MAELKGYKKPKSFDEILSEKMAKDNFDPSTGRKAGEPKDEKEKEIDLEEPEEQDGDESGEEPEEGKPEGDEEPSAEEGEEGEEPSTEGELEEGDEKGELEEEDTKGISIDSDKPLPKDMPPEKLRKELLKDYTKKTTKLATERRALGKVQEELAGYRNWIQSYVQQVNQKFVEVEAREAQLMQPARARQALKISEMSDDQKDAYYKSMGIDVDNLTDPNLLKVLDIVTNKFQEDAVERQTERQRSAEDERRRVSERFIDTEAEDLKRRYAKLKTELKLPKAAELMILAHLGNVRRNQNPDYTIEQATQDYIAGGGDGTESETAFLETVKRSPHYKKLQAQVIEAARKAKGTSVIIPSSKAGGINSLTPPNPAKREKFATMDQAAERFKADLAKGASRGFLRHRR